MTLGCVGSWVTAAVAKGATRRPGLLSAADATRRRAAPNTHADSGGPAPQSRAAVPGSAPWPVPILVRSRLRGHSKCDGLTSLAEGPVRHSSRAGRVVRRFLLFPGRRGGGRVDFGMVPRHQARLTGDSFALIPLVPRPTAAAWP